MATPHASSRDRALIAGMNLSPTVGATSSQLPNKHPPSTAPRKNQKSKEKLGLPAAAATIAVGRKTEQRPVAGGRLTSKTSPSQPRLPQSPSQSQQEVSQPTIDVVVTAREAPVEGFVIVSSGSNSGDDDDDNGNNGLPHPTSDLALAATVTDGYISFAESDPGRWDPSLAALGDNTAATSVQARRESYAAGDHEQQSQPTTGSKNPDDNASGDEKWDFGDEDSDDEQEICGGAVVTDGGSSKNRQDSGGEQQQQQQQQSSHVIGGNSGGDRAVPVAPGSPPAGNGGVGEPHRARVVVDRLGRREITPKQ